MTAEVLRTVEIRLHTVLVCHTTNS
jgi:hypothetical protein